MIAVSDRAIVVVAVVVVVVVVVACGDGILLNAMPKQFTSPTFSPAHACTLVGLLASARRLPRLSETTRSV